MLTASKGSLTILMQAKGKVGKIYEGEALKLYIYYYTDIYLKDVILLLSWGTRK